jgi:hypothetical protein
MVGKVVFCLCCSGNENTKYFCGVSEHSKIDAGIWVDTGSITVVEANCFRATLPYLVKPLGVQLVMPVRYRYN